MKKEILLSILKKFYKSIENNKSYKFYDEDIWSWYDYKDFPNWRCDSTSEILMKFLKEEYNFEFQYRKCEYNFGNYHIYIINNNYLIDITASQFNSKKIFPEFNWEKFPKITLLEWNEKENYFFENEVKYISLSNDYEETFIYNKSYIDFYSKLVKDYHNLLI